MQTRMPPVMTAEELFAYPEDPEVWLYELERGKPIPIYGHGVRHATVVGNFYRHLYEFLRSCGLGTAMVGGLGFVLARDPDTVRIPDGSFLTKEQTEEARQCPGFVTVVPALVKEVVSPTKPAEKLNRRVADYIAAGVRVVLVAWSEENRLSIYPGSMTPFELSADDTFDGGDIQPGLQIPVAELLKITW